MNWLPTEESSAYHLCTESVSPIRCTTTTTTHSRALQEKRNPNSILNVPAEDHRSLRQQCDKLQRELRDAQEQLRREHREKLTLQEKLSEATSEKSRRHQIEAAETRKRIREEEANEKKHINELQSRLKEEKARVDTLTAELKKEHTESTIANETLQLREVELVQLQSQCDHHRDECSVLEKKCDDLETLLANVKSEMIILKAEHDEALSSLRHLNNDRQSFEAEGVMLMEQITTLQSTNRELAKELCETRTELESARSELDRIRVDYTNRTQESKHQRSEVETLTARLHAAHEQVSVLSTNLHNLNEQHLDAKRQIAIFESNQEHARRQQMADEEEATNLRGRMELLAQQLDEKERLFVNEHQKASELEKTLSSVQSNVVSLQQMMETSTQEVQYAKRELERAVTERNQLIRDLKALEDTISLESAMTSKYRDDYSEAQVKLRDALSENETLKFDMESRSRIAETEQGRAQSLLTALTRAQEDIVLLRKNFEAEQQRVQELDSAHRDACNVSECRDRELSALRQELAARDSEVDALQKEVRQLRSERDVLESRSVRLTELEKQLSSKEEEAQHLRTRLLQVDGALSAQQREYANVESQRTCLQKEIQDLHVLLENKSKEIKELILEHDAYVQRCTHEEATTQRRMDEKETEWTREMEVVLCEREEARKQLQERTQSLRESLEEAQSLKNNLADLRASLQHALDESTRASAQLAAARSEKEVLSEHITELEERLTNIHAECLKHNVELEKARESIQESAVRVINLEQDLQRRCEERLAYEEEITALRQQVHTAQEALRLAIAAHEESEDRFAKLRCEAEQYALESADRLENEDRLREQQVTELRQTIQTVQNEIKALHEETQAAYATLNQTWQSRYTALEVERDAQVQERCDEIGRLQQTIAGAQVNVQELTDRLAQERAEQVRALAEATELRRCLEQNTGERVAMEHTIQDFKARCDQLQGIEQRLQHNLSESRTELAQLRAALNGERGATEAMRTHLSAEIEDLTQKVEKLNAEVNELQCCNEELESARNDYRGRALLMQRETEELLQREQVRYRKVQDERDTYIKKYHVACWEVKDVKRQRAEFEKLYVTECDTLEHMKNTYNSVLEQQKGYTRATHETLVRTNKVYQQQVSHLQRERDALVQTVLSLRKNQNSSQ